MAFEKGMTIIELLMKSILKSYRSFVQNGIIIEDPETVKRQDTIYQDLVNIKGGTLRKFCHWNLTNLLSYNDLAASI